MMMNFLDLSAASEEERRLIREILSDTSVVSIAEPQATSQSTVLNATLLLPTSSSSSSSKSPPPPSSTTTHTAPLQLPSQAPSTAPLSTLDTATSTTSSHTTNNLTRSNQAPQNHRSNFNSQRKNIHNSNNINSIVNNSGGNIRNTRLPNLGNVSTNSLHSVQQQQQPQAHHHHPQQYTPPLPSNASLTAHYHNISVNNNHSANALSSQRANKHSNDRLRGSLNTHISNNNVINIVVTSSSGLATLVPNLDQHHGNTMPSTVYSHHHIHHQVPPVMPTAKLDPSKSSHLKNQAYQSQDTSTSSIQSSTSVAQSVPTSAHMSAMAGDMNQVISMDMASTQPPGYAIPQHVTAFGPPPPHHVYSGPPIFHQPYPYLYNIYNMPYMPYHVPLPSNSVVPPRQQAPPQSNQSPSSTTTTNSPSRSHSHHLPQQRHQHHQQQLLQQHHQQQHSHGQYNNLDNSNNQVNQHQSSNSDATSDRDISLSHHSQNLKDVNEKGLPDIQKNSTSNKTSNTQSSQMHKKVEKAKRSLEAEPSQEDSSQQFGSNQVSQELNNVVVGVHSPKADSDNKIVSNVFKNGPTIIVKNRNNVSVMRGDRTENQLPKSEVDSLACQSGVSNKILLSNRSIQTEVDKDSVKRSEAKTSSMATLTKPNGEDVVKLSSDESFDTQSSLDVSKQSQESSIPTRDQPKSSPENCNKSLLEKAPRDMMDLNNKVNEVSQRGGGGSSASSKSWADVVKRGETALLGSSINVEADHNVSGSENSDEEVKNRRSSTTKVHTIVKVSNLVSTSKEHRSQEAAKRSLDKMAPKFAQKINSMNLKHSLPFLKPRGFINKGNGCYINATLQALIACPPFYNLMKEIGDLRGFRRDDSCTPILDSFAELFLNFPPLDASKKNKQATSQDQKLNINYLQAEAIEPKCIYNVLGQIKSECLKGAQEDAEEFLSSVLNGLHEEMIGLSEIQQSSQELSTQNGHSSDLEDSNDDITNDDNLWREVGPKNRSLPIRTAKVINTPIQEIFGGSLFSVRTAGKDRCGHRSPFFDLQLDISGDNVKSVQDAIKSFTATETIHDFYCSKTKQKLDAQRRTSLDQLPPILILHLKQFVYTQDHGLKKLMKKIEYPIDFELPEVCLHEKISNDKNLRTSRTYKLLAVVYHDGKEAIKGHYLTDVYHIGSSQWIRCDDSNLKVITVPRIENPDSFRTPYLLFYRRLNTLRAQTGNHDNKKKS